MFRSQHGLARALAVVNDARRAAHGATASSEAAEVEADLDRAFRVTETLAAYGTLAPGRTNHHIVAPLGGRWTTGVVRGTLSSIGWGSALGYPAFHADPDGGHVPVHVLHSERLRAAWPELDDFEGPEYVRILVPVWAAEEPGAPRLLTVANLYAARASGPSNTVQPR